MPSDASLSAESDSTEGPGKATGSGSTAGPIDDSTQRSEVPSIDLEDVADAGSVEGPAPGSKVEAVLVSLIALFMMFLPVVHTLVRRFFGKDIPGTGLFVQHATLWIGFLGALLATAGGKHLGLATANFMPPGKLRSFAEWISAFTFSLVACFLTYASARLVSAIRGGNGEHLPGGIPVWWSDLVMPAAFAVMAVRAVVRATAGTKPGAHELPSSHCPPPVHPRIRLGLRILSGLCAAAALFAGLTYDSQIWVRLLVDRLDALHGAVLYIGSSLIMVSFLLGTPVFIAMAGIAMVLFFASGTPISPVAQETARLVQNPTLPAIPLLTVAGYILAAGNASRRLVRAYKSVFGWLPGGLAVMVVFVCAIFTTFTGASGVTILALGGLVYPLLIRDNYPQGFSLGLVTAAGSLGLLFPPSLPVLLYSVAASAPGAAAPVSAEQLFIGGLIPGILLILLVSLYGIHKGYQQKAPRQAFNGREVLHAIWDAKWDLFLPFIVIGTVAGGLATVVEAAAFGATYALLVELFVFRDVHPLKELPGVLAHAALLVGAVVVLLGAALGLTNYLVDQELPGKLVDWVQLHIHAQWLFLLALNVILLVLGSVLEIYSAIVVLVPLVAPLGVAYNIHPVHLGVIFLANLELGFLFPPMGLNLFLSATRFQKPLPVLYRQALPFLLIMSVGVLIITYVEVATTGLLRVFGKY